MKNLFLLVLCIFTFSSCSNDDTILSNTSVSNESVDSKSMLKTIEFSYKDKFYSSEYYQEGDSVFILDYETQKVYNELGKNENKFVVVSEDNKVTYFDNESEYPEFGKSKLQLRSTESKPYFRVTVRLYKNKDPLFYSTTTMLIESTYSLRSDSSIRGNSADINLFSFPDLRVYNHNDNISLANVSLSIGNMTPDFNFRGQAGLHMWEHINYGGENISGYAATAWNNSKNGPMKSGEEVSETTEIKVKAYKKYNGDGFNDIISSLKIILTITNMNGAGSSKESQEVTDVTGTSEGRSGSRSESNPDPTSSTRSPGSRSE